MMVKFPFYRPRPSSLATPDDDAHAEKIKADAELKETLERGRVVAQLASELAERRQLNHFGDSLSISFTPRRHRRA